MTIPLLQPSCSHSELDAVRRAMRSGWWGNGPLCAEFERELARRTGYADVVTVNSATAALHLALLACGIGPGDEVIVPALTFVSTALAVSYTGARPVFADVDAETLAIDAESVAQVVTRRSKAIIPVDYAGLPARGSWSSFGLPVIEDAAHAPLMQHYGDFVVYSFHPVKPLATGDGGAVLLNDASVAARLRALRWCGIDRDTWARTQSRYGWDYAIDEVGYKCHWNDIQAAIGLEQLKRFDTLLNRRRELAARYCQELGSLDMLQLPAFSAGHCWHLFVVRTDASLRNSLLDHLTARGISAGVHYKPLTYYAPYADHRTPEVTDREWRRLVTLPLYSSMTDAQQSEVIDAIIDWSATL